MSADTILQLLNLNLNLYGEHIFVFLISTSLGHTQTLVSECNNEVQSAASSRAYLGCILQDQD